jgi:hypothetical protein
MLLGMKHVGDQRLDINGEVKGLVLINANEMEKG